MGTDGSNAFLGNVSFPFRWWTFSANASYSEYLVYLNDFADLFGYSTTGSVNLSQVVFRNTHHKTELLAGFNINETQRFINDVQLDPQRHSSVGLGISHLYRKPKTVLTGALNYRRGLDLYDLETDTGFGGFEGPNPEFNLISFDASALHQVKPWLAYQGILHAQYSFDNLFSTDQLFLGDYFSVRGYRDGSIGGDWGGYLRNDLSLKRQPTPNAPFWIKWTQPFEPYIFTDVGYAFSDAETGDIWLTGGGAGISASLGKKLKADAYAAQPLWSSDNVPDGDDTLFYFSIYLTIFQSEFLRFDT